MRTKAHVRINRPRNRRIISVLRHRPLVVGIASLLGAGMVASIICPALLKSAGHLLWDARTAAVEFLFTVLAVSAQRRRARKLAT
jgi:hypothetical protein